MVPGGIIPCCIPGGIIPGGMPCGCMPGCISPGCIIPGCIIPGCPIPGCPIGGGNEWVPARPYGPDGIATGCCCCWGERSSLVVIRSPDGWVDSIPYCGGTGPPPSAVGAS